MNEAVLDSEGGRSLTLRRATWPDRESFESFDATLRLPSGEMTAPVWDYRGALPEFFADLAESWRGFDGAKEYDTVEGQLQLSCTWDGLGAVRCRATLGSLEPPEWSVSAVLTWGAGAHLERLAAEVARFARFP